MRKIFFLILIPTMSAAQSSRGGIGYDSGGGDTAIGAFLAIGTAIIIMLLGIGRAIGEAGNEKLKEIKKSGTDRRIEKKIKRNQSEVTQELRKKPADPNKTEEQNRKEAVISIQRKRLRALNEPLKDFWWKW